MRGRLLVIWASVLVNAGCSVFGIRTSEEISYAVLEENDDIEIRRYSPYLAAEASMTGGYESVQRPLFRVLAGYIFGKNTAQKPFAQKVDVHIGAPGNTASESAAQASAPDEQQTSEKIAMTAPVLVVPAKANTWTMKFSIPTKYTIDTVPKPVDPRVQLIEVPAKTVAVLRFSGAFGDLPTREAKTAVLLERLAENRAYKAIGQPYYAGYDPPFTLPFLRRNEVLVEVTSR
ncbi:MAG: heme-binding protein [Myxococcota bacterium]|nr:heme-binding protein [Myxococcota bacterium]